MCGVLLDLYLYDVHFIVITLDHSYATTYTERLGAVLLLRLSSVKIAQPENMS